MGGARDAGWVAAGLVLGAGVCYCIYWLTRGPRRGGWGRRLRPSRSAEDLTKASYNDVLSAERIKKLLYLLKSTEDPVLIERALGALGHNTAFLLTKLKGQGKYFPSAILKGLTLATLPGNILYIEKNN